MATASGDASGARRAVMPYVAYGVVMVLLGGAGIAFWSGEWDRRPILPGNASAAPTGAMAPVATPPPPPAPAPTPPITAPPPAEPARPTPLTLKLPPRPPTPRLADTPAAATPAQAPPPTVPSVEVASTPPAPAPSPAATELPTQAPAPEPTPATAPAPPATPPSPSEASASLPAAAPAEKPVPPKSRCTVDGAWPAEKTDQGKAIQGMLRDLGLYDGTVYGTVGPTTRAAIRKFQVSAGQPETGEPDEALFDSLKKRCATPPS